MPSLAALGLIGIQDFSIAVMHDFRLQVRYLEADDVEAKAL